MIKKLLNKLPTEHIKSIDSLKFIFSIIIVYYHLFHIQLRPFLHNSEIFRELTFRTFSAVLIVDCFLVMSGYFLYQTIKTNKLTIYQFILKIFFRIYPVFFVSTIITYIQSPTSIDELVLKLFLFHSTGISLHYFGATWFIGPFFWCSILLFSIFKTFEKHKSALIIAIFTYFSYATIINNFNGWIERNVVYSFLSIAMIRVFGGLSLGILLHIAKEVFNDNLEQIIPNKAKTILVSIIEIICLSTLLYNFTIFPIFKNFFITIIIFSILFACLISTKGILSKLLQIKYLSILGKFSYSIYVMQQVAFNILQKTLWQNTNFIYSHTILTLFISVMLATFIGIITYYTIERPIQKFYAKYLS